MWVRGRGARQASFSTFGRCLPLASSPPQEHPSPGGPQLGRPAGYLDLEMHTHLTDPLISPGSTSQFTKFSSPPPLQKPVILQARGMPGFSSMCALQGGFPIWRFIFCKQLPSQAAATWRGVHPSGSLAPFLLLPPTVELQDSPQLPSAVCPTLLRHQLTLACYGFAHQSHKCHAVSPRHLAQ